MKTTTIKALTLLTAALSFAACSKNESNIPNPTGQVDITTRLSASTDGGSATPDDGITSAYAPAEGTELSLYYTHVGNTQNALFRFSGDAWQCTRQLYWDDLDMPSGTDGYPFFAASPQTPGANPAVSADQSSAEAYRQSDQLLAYTVAAKRQEKLNINFRHVLSQLKVELESPAGDNQVKLADVTLSVLGSRQAYTLAYTGTAPTTNDDATKSSSTSSEVIVPSSTVPAIATVAGSTAPLTPYTVSRNNGSATDAAQAVFLAIVPPQSAMLKLVFTIEGKTYSYDGAQAKFTAGRNTAYKLRITKTSVTLSGITLEAWDDTDPATEASIRADLTGEAPTPGTGTEAIKGNEMNIWKQATDAQADKSNAHLYTLSGNVWSSTQPIYVDDTDLAADRFYATIANSAPDAQTTVPDLLGAGPAQMGKGQLAFGFTHLMAQFAINVKPGADFPAGISLKDATVSTPALQQAYTLAYAADGAALQVTPATDAATLLPLKNLETGVAATDAATGETLYLVVPQTIAAGASFTVRLGDKTYTGTLSAALPLLPGRKNVLTLTLGATQMGIGAIALEPWIEGSKADGSTKADGIKDLTTTITGIDEAGILYLAALSGTDVASGGQGAYPLVIEQGKAVSRDLTGAILWDNLATGTYRYNALFAPTAFRYGANASHNHERDYLTATSAPTDWGKQPNFGTNGQPLKHAMSQFTVILKSVDGSFEANELAAATVQVFSLRSAAPATDRASLSFTELTAEKTVSLIRSADATDASQTALVAPQTLHRVLITLDGKTYMLKKELLLSANQISTLEVNVQRTPLGFTVDVTDWSAKDNVETGDVDIDE